MEEIKFLLSLIWKFNMDAHIAKAFEVFDHNKDGLITLTEFLKQVHSAEVLLFPVFQLQIELREKSLVGLLLLSNIR